MRLAIFVNSFIIKFKNMKNFLVLFGAVLFLGAAQAQTTVPKPPTSKSDMSTVTTDVNTKEHVCTAACKDGKHVYAHGERGHKCGAECMKAMSRTTADPAKPDPAKPDPKTNLKEHVCNASCTKDKHNYLHGEKGHKCTAACHKTKTSSAVSPAKKS
jgi:hypothetical protein